VSTLICSVHSTQLRAISDMQHMQQAAKDSPSSWPAECWTSYIIVELYLYY